MGKFLKVVIGCFIIISILLFLYYVFIHTNIHLAIFFLGGVLFMSVIFEIPNILLVKKAKEIDEYAPFLHKNIAFWVAILLMAGPPIIYIFI